MASSFRRQSCHSERSEESAFSLLSSSTFLIADPGPFARNVSFCHSRHLYLYRRNPKSSRSPPLPALSGAKGLEGRGEVDTMAADVEDCTPPILPLQRGGNGRALLHRKGARRQDGIAHAVQHFFILGTHRRQNPSERHLVAGHEIIRGQPGPSFHRCRLPRALVPIRHLELAALVERLEHVGRRGKGI